MQLSIPSPSLGAQNKTRYSLQTVLRALCVALTMISLITAAKTPVYATWGTWRYCQGNVISNPAAVRWGDGWIDVFSLNQQ